MYQRTKVGLRLLEFRFYAFSLTYVAGNCRSPDNLSFGIPDGRNGHRNVDSFPILSDTNGFIMLDSLVPLQPFQDFRQFVALFGRHENADRLSDYFTGFVAIDPLGAGVPTHDLPVQRLSYNCVV